MANYIRPVPFRFFPHNVPFPSLSGNEGKKSEQSASYHMPSRRAALVGEEVDDYHTRKMVQVGRVSNTLTIWERFSRFVGSCTGYVRRVMHNEIADTVG